MGVAGNDFSVVLVLLREVPAGSWVAISSDNRLILASGQDMRTVLIAAKNAGESDPIVIRVPR